MAVRSPLQGPSTHPAGTRLRVGVVKYASCDGCQLTLLDLEDELLDIVERFELVEFPEASSVRSAGPFDLLLVEGSISTPEQAAEIVELRRAARRLVTIGACASAGGIQALRNWIDHEAFRSAVYAHPEYVASLATATPVREHVPVDFELTGCPISKAHLRELLAALAVGRRPQIREEAVCLDCKRRGTVCVMVARNVPCLGPVTQTGCGALCPAYGRGCYGCFGPREQANADGLASWLVAGGRSEADVGRLFAGFTAYAEPFRSVVTRLGGTRMTPGSPVLRAAAGAPEPGAAGPGPAPATGHTDPSAGPAEGTDAPAGRPAGRAARKNRGGSDARS
jgi:coenzyme F420-reducing hydrogenase gamma subunit